MDLLTGQELPFSMSLYGLPVKGVPQIKSVPALLKDPDQRFGLEGDLPSSNPLQKSHIGVPCISGF